mmetsp:Transcript_56841/g.164984  ORF Transcript_56841/g.164984 Transcript_56841/m.164984 type:complete len:196 (-) Transcript_56841:72-659(-)
MFSCCTEVEVLHDTSVIPEMCSTLRDAEHIDGYNFEGETRSSCGALSPGKDRDWSHLQTKDRLRRAAVAFFARAQVGIDLLVFDFSAKIFRKAVFELNRHFTHISFRWKDREPHVMCLRDLAQPEKGDAALADREGAGLLRRDRCVVLGMETDTQRFGCCLASAETAREFFNGMFILRLCVRFPGSVGRRATHGP